MRHFRNIWMIFSLKHQYVPLSGLVIEPTLIQKMNFTNQCNGNDIGFEATEKRSLFLFSNSVGRGQRQCTVFIRLISFSSWFHRQTTFAGFPGSEMSPYD